MNLVTFFKLIRYKNLVLLIYLQLLIKWVFFPAFHSITFLSSFQYLLFISSIVFITAAGYVINDIFDVETDVINKPSKLIISKVISIETGTNIYKILNAIGLALGILLCLAIEKPNLSFIFVGASLLLYYYSKFLKKMSLVGNLVVSFLIAFTIVMVLIFDLRTYFIDSFKNFDSQTILLIATFAFLLNLSREIIKDIQDINGDYKLKMNTLPILIGIKRASYITAFTLIISFGLIADFIADIVYDFKITAYYSILFIALPLLYISFKLIRAKSKLDFKNISFMLKLIMFFGCNILLILSLN